MTQISFYYRSYILALNIMFLLLGTLHAQNTCNIEIGTNLSGISDYSTEIPFANLMKMSRAWYTKGECDPSFQWDTGHAALLSYDENGYPTHIPQIISGVSLPQRVATVWDGTSGWPDGKYTLLWDGAGDFEFWGDHRNLMKINSNQYEFDYTGAEGGILQITMTESLVGDPVTNMRLLLPGTAGLG